MKRGALFLTAAVAGLACGSLFRWGAAAASGDSAAATARRALALPSGPGNDSRLSQEKPRAVREWESRLARHLNGPVPAAATGAGITPQAQADTVLRLLREPVSETSIREAVALFNASGGHRYAEVMASVFERWAREAPQAALAAVRGLREPGAKAALLWKVFEVSAGEPGVMDKAMELPKGMLRSVALAALAESIPPGSESAALHELIKNRRPGDGNELGGFPYALFEKLGKRGSADPGAPLRLALETEDPAWRAYLLEAALTHEGLESVPSLEELARDPRNVEGLMEFIGGRIDWEQHQAKMNELLAALPEAKRREVLVRQAGLWFRDEGLEVPQTNEALRMFLEELKRTEGGEGYRDLFAKSALARGTRGLENAALQLAERKNPGELEDLTRRAAAAEPFTTARWLAAMPPSPERDRAVAVFAETHAAVDPERAAVWAESIADPARREAALSALGKKASAAR